MLITNFLKCLKCRQSKPAADFQTTLQRRDGKTVRSRYCARCLTFERTKTHKTCSQCQERKPVIQFSRSDNTIDGFNSRCRSCCNVSKQLRRAKQKAEAVFYDRPCDGCKFKPRCAATGESCNAFDVWAESGAFRISDDMTPIRDRAT